MAIDNKMFVFECSITYASWFGDDTSTHKEDIKAETASKARYKFYKGMDADEPYKDYFRYIKVRKLYECDANYVDDVDNRIIEGIKRTAEYRQVPFVAYGMKVKVRDKFGKIVGHNSSANFNVDFGNGVPMNCHPHYMITYYDENDNVIKEFNPNPKS